MTATDHVDVTPDAGTPVEDLERVIRTTDGVVCCEVCDWAAAMTGDNWAEIEAFLRARLREHTQHWHGQRTERPS
jgi:hypothetical protein